MAMRRAMERMIRVCRWYPLGISITISEILFPSGAASQQAVTHALRVKAGLILHSHRVRLDFSLLQVRFDFRWPSEVIADHVIDIGEIQGGILLDDFFSSCAVRVAPQNSVELVKLLSKRKRGYHWAWL